MPPQPKREGAFSANLNPETLKSFKELCKKDAKQYSKVLERLVEFYLQCDGALPVPPFDKGHSFSDSAPPRDSRDLINQGVNVNLYVSESTILNSVSIKSYESSPRYVDHISELIQRPVVTDNVNEAIVSAFNNNNHKQVLQRLEGFLSSKLSPSVDLVDFEIDSILGAYILGHNRILISKSVVNTRLFDRIILEEFGHWLDDGLPDSKGDEGDVFAKTLLGIESSSTLTDAKDLYQFVELDNQLYRAEFSIDTQGDTLKEVLDRLEGVKSDFLDLSSTLEMLLHRVEALEDTQNRTKGAD